MFFSVLPRTRFCTLPHKLKALFITVQNRLCNLPFTSYCSVFPLRVLPVFAIKKTKQKTEHHGPAGIGGPLPQHGSSAVPQRFWVLIVLSGLASREGGTPPKQARGHLSQGNGFLRAVLCVFRKFFCPPSLSLSLGHSKISQSLREKIRTRRRSSPGSRLGSMRRRVTFLFFSSFF